MKKFILTALFSVLFCFSSYAAEVTLIWDANTETDLEGYRLYYGLASGDYDISIKMSKSLLPTYTIGGLKGGITYYIAATAHDMNGNESNFSNEVVYTSPVVDKTKPIPPGQVKKGNR